MLVPSVMLPKLRFRAGSWKREPPPLLLKRDDMVAVVRSVSVDNSNRSWHGSKMEHGSMNGEGPSSERGSERRGSKGEATGGAQDADGQGEDGSLSR